MDGWKNFFHSCAMNRRYCSGSCWGKERCDRIRHGARTEKGMDSEVKALYQGAGISHLLAISGLHLSLIGAGLFGLLKKVRLPVALSAGISTWILIVYAQLTGMGISTRRALVMFFAVFGGGLLKRTPDLPTSLAVAALLLLVPRPQRILDAGFQLSFSAVIGIAVMIPVFAGWLGGAAPSLRVANRVTDGVAGWNIAWAVIARACSLLRKISLPVWALP